VSEDGLAPGGVTLRTYAQYVRDEIAKVAEGEEVEAVTRIDHLLSVMDRSGSWTGRGELCLKAFMTRDCPLGHDWKPVLDIFVPFSTIRHIAGTTDMKES
jgi:hypothetical protein